MTTRTAPPTRRSTSASLVSQPTSACHQRRITSSLVHASNTASAGAWKVRSMRSVLVSLTLRAPAGAAGAGSATRARRADPCPCRPAPGRSPPPARLPREPSRAGPRSPLGGGLGREGGLEDGRLLVGVVEVPPPVGRRLRVAVGRILPVLLAAERGDVEVGPGAAQRLVTA